MVLVKEILEIRRGIMLNRKTSVCFFLVLILVFPAIASSQKMEYKDYKVVEGDTLWDISTRELKDPFLWPKIWKENPEVKNPDRIYPDQVIRIPLYLIQQPEQPVVEQVPIQAPAPVVEEAPKPVVKVTPPLVHQNIYISSGFLGDISSFAGSIDGHASGRTLFGNNDKVYVTLNGDAKVGDRFYIYRKENKVTHPNTGQFMGYVIEPKGILEIVKFEYGHTIAQILQVFGDIYVGDMLNPFFQMKPPVVEHPFRRPEIDGYVVASRQLRLWNALSDIVFIDRGSSHGLQPGDLIGTVSDVKVITKYTIPNGILQVIKTEETTSTALVVKINERTPDRLIIPGNRLVRAEF